MYKVYISFRVVANRCLRPATVAVAHAAWEVIYLFSDAQMTVVIASHRPRLSGLMGACLAGIHFFTQYSLLIFSEI